MRPTAALRMQATRILRAGHGPDPKNGVYMGSWGNLGSPAQKNIVTYALSPNRQNPTSTLIPDAIFNTFRRTRNQVLYWVPPLLVAYLAMDWATERNEYLNSKPGRAEFGES
ncbi:ubiquinol-cytochrome c reductase subunit 8 [Cladophialophora psammophila CBS 110553]|uniref:Cytochrome b-c1 complex subunit 8 n=1 Tax=Cladophialophora psammophila CBS 110553 TaxID=1182543 RepID=W9VZW1_9EURO|nr:ubiquinol-cytochrome c reductase subunit 8 [Cladophialophora psammophila CBS 110553]EXJ57801.1 ubiquinol-cytochrome c reductase subunit 8 [Cladophialophora psammophila CBS 110553]